MKDLVDRFTMKVVQDSINVFKYLRKRDPDSDAEATLLGLLDDHKAMLQERVKADLAKIPKCPDCGTVLMSREITDSPAGYKSNFACPAEACDYDHYSPAPINSEYKARMEK